MQIKLNVRSSSDLITIVVMTLVKFSKNFQHQKYTATVYNIIEGMFKKVCRLPFKLVFKNFKKRKVSQW